jgi:hypothetical protein
MTITQTLPLPLDGVSQQPDEIRLQTCVSEMINCDASQVGGLSTRPSTKFVAKLSGWSPVSYALSHVHFIDRNATEKWMVVLNGYGTVDVVDALTGASATVSYQDEAGATIAAPTTYLTATTPRESFRCMTVGDYTFIGNREVTVGSATDTVTWGSTVTVQTTTALPATPAANTLYVVRGFAPTDRTYFAANPSATGVYAETRAAAVTVPDKATLPWTLVKTGASSFVLRRGNYRGPMVGDDGNNFPPSFIGRQIRDIFYYRNRLGFITSSSIVMTQPLTNINAFLGIVYDFYRKSMSLVSDDDGIDVTVSHHKAPTLNSAALYNKTLIIFGDTVQFQLQPLGDILSPKTFAINPVTEFDCSQTVRPIGLGPRVYFSQPSSGGMRVREFYVQKDKLALDAVDITAQCPTYVSPNVFRMVASSAENVLVAATDPFTPEVGTANGANGAVLYIYRPDFDGKGERQQSSWSKYQLDNTEYTVVVGMGFSQSKLYLLLARTSGLYLETIDFVTPSASFPSLGNWPADTGLLGTSAIEPCLDRSVTYAAGTGVYSLVTGRTVWTSAFTLSGLTAGTKMSAVVLSSTGVNMVGVVAEAVVDNATQFSVLGDFSQQRVAVGFAVKMFVVLSRIQLWGKKGPEFSGDLRVRTLELSLRESGPIKVFCQSLNQQPHSGIIGGPGVGYSLIGLPRTFTGKGRVTINASASKTLIELISTTPIRTTVTGITWEGEFNRRTQRV